MPGAEQSSDSGDRRLAVGRVAEDTVVVRVGGTWRLDAGAPPLAAVEGALARPPAVRRVRFDAGALCRFDSSVVAFLASVVALGKARGAAVDEDGLPPGIRRILALADSVPETTARRPSSRPDLLTRVGERALGALEAGHEFLRFVGEITRGGVQVLRRRARYRTSDVVLLMQQVGADALPIVTLVGFLVGAILAFVGAVQLEQFGAAIYVANLVGIAIVRDMGTMMTAIVMAGRSGASFAAELATMNVTQETDALTTTGLPPLEFLVLPRVIALCAMMPLLCLYADLLGIVGGGVVGTGMLGLSARTYAQQTAGAVSVTDLVGGVFKAGVYGLLIAIAGCLRGMAAGRSSSAVGAATTSAVVTSIVLVIAACGVFSVVFYVLGI
jgi:phospholipid/cholesterol/gamma-HCH transport system permease protein